MDTHDLEEPFKSQPIDGYMDVHGRSVALLMEDGIPEPEREPRHTEIPVIEVELSHAEPADATPKSQDDPQAAASHPESEQTSTGGASSQRSE